VQKRQGDLHRMLDGLTVRSQKDDTGQSQEQAPQAYAIWVGLGKLRPLSSSENAAEVSVVVDL
jgi:hypothetical protein